MNIILCRCMNNNSFNRDKINNIFNLISRLNANIYDVNDICGLFVNDGKNFKKIFNDSVNIVIACYPRTIENLLSRMNINYDNMRFINIFKDSEDDIKKLLKEISVDAGDAKILNIDSNNNWIPWYPVIDYSRCTNCRQCLNFCLFGVYSLSNNGRVEVVQPKNCKTNCPACARICPSVAIIFPKYNEAPINGDEIADEEFQKARVKVDMNNILGDDPYKALLDRRLKGKTNKLLKN